MIRMNSKSKESKKMRLRKIWDIKDSQISDELLKACEGNHILATLLANRGITTEEKANRFLNPLKNSFTAPNVFIDIQKSVERINSAIEKNEHIVVYGDFDADGITSTSLLYITLKELGANVNFYLPNRATESHGLNSKALVTLIAKERTKLIITVDCGISNVKEVNFANSFKVDVIVTDHHEAPEILPNAYAIINPKSPNSLRDDLSAIELESLNNLAGVGVAFKLACQLLEHHKKQDFIHEILPLVAVGTIGDIVDLTGENRSLVSMGLELIRKGKNKGIQKLFALNNISDISTITSETITYQLVPRLNASGRLDSPDSALKLLISKDDEVINQSVVLLNDLNSLRQNLCEEAFSQADEMYRRNVSKHKKSIILFNECWHVGIIGIVASKLVEKYNKPTFLMTRDTNNQNIIRCSCRSIQGVNVHSVLTENKELFEGFGGHKMAAGLSFDETKNSFEKVKSKIERTIDEQSQGIDFSIIKLPADMVLNAEDLTIENIQAIEKLQPFGAANPAPVFVANDLKLKSYRFMGKENNHLKIFAQKDSVAQIECVKWSTPNFNLPNNSLFNVLFSMNINEFNGNKSVQLILSDIQSDALKDNEEFSEIKILDHRNKTNILVQVLDFISTTKKRTAIFLENITLLKSLNLSEDVNNLVFSTSSIPSETEQIMFFDCPNNEENFCKIIKESDAKIVHLMNFDVAEISVNSFVSKLSGMIKYALGNLNGELNLEKLSKALGVDEETVDCAISLFENVNMIEIEKNNDSAYKVVSFNSVELSKITQDELFETLKEQIDAVNSFRNFYLNSSVEEIKEKILA